MSSKLVLVLNCGSSSLKFAILEFSGMLPPAGSPYQMEN